MLTMLDRHKVHTLRAAGYSYQRIATTLKIARSTVQRILAEPVVTATAVADPATVRRTRGVGRPRTTPALGATLAAWLTAEPHLSGREALRRLREQGQRLADSTFYRAWLTARGEARPTPVQVRFEGVPGEFAQFDFGECVVTLTDGRTQRIHFACYRLKYSRWMYVQVVPDQQVESLIRALLNGFVSAAGVPLRVVFDRPRTVVIGQTAEGLPKWNTTLERVAVDYGFTIEVCAPRRGNQKGSVEALVKFVKQNFFTQRRFADLAQDLPTQLLEWLTDVNTRRTSRATQQVPADRLAEEQPRLKPLAVDPDRYGLAFPVFVGPTAMVEFRAVRYAMPPAAASTPATLTLYPDRVRLVSKNGKHDVIHPRFPAHGVSYLPGQRAAQLAKVAGDRGRTYFMRERILELGEVAAAYVTELVHARPYVWAGDVDGLFTLLERVGDARFLQLVQYALFKRLFGAEYVLRLEQHLAPAAPPARPQQGGQG